MSRALLFIDNLRIGGFQRLALDQAYGLSERGYKTRIYVLDNQPNSDTPSFLTSEQEFLDSLQIEIITLGKSRAGQLYALRKISCEANSRSLVLSHSLRATFLMYFAGLISGTRLKVITTIHQLPTLSGPRQRFQRFIYAQFTWSLLAYSFAVKEHWDTRARKNVFCRPLMARKKIEVMRNGIYLNRLPENVQVPGPVHVPRLVYLGRNTSWKGVSTFLEIAMQPELKNFQLLFMVPSVHDINLSLLSKDIRERTTVVGGKTIAAYQPRFGDIHLYPANYGEGARYIESVSLNCLELACLGVPTLLTRGGLGTWPDLVSFNIFHETDWGNYSEIASQILEISKSGFEESVIEELAHKIDIQNQLTKLIALASTNQKS
jgi:glycosyltransferase involved in cell wall biosynthesis